jgi:hypothetical protein
VDCHGPPWLRGETFAFAPLALNPDIRLALHRIVKPVRKIRYARRECQFDNLFFGEMLAQVLQIAIAESGRRPRQLVRIVDDRAVFLVK